MESCCDAKICKYIDSIIIKLILDSDLLNWTKPCITSSLLALVNAMFIIMAVSKLNICVLLAYMFLFYVVSGVVIAQFMNKPEPDTNEYEHLSKDTLEKALKFLYNTFYCCDLFMKKVVSLSDIALTVKFFVGLYAFMTVSAWFSDCFLIWLTINLLFAWKPVVNTQKERIDNVMAKVCGIWSNAVSKVVEVIPKYKEPTLKKD